MSDPAGGPHSIDPVPPPPFSPPPNQYGQPGYGQAGYGQPAYPAPALKPGIIPLRPLTLTDVFNGAIGYIRKNPRATLGMTAVVVIVAQLIALALQLCALAVFGTRMYDPSIKSSDSLVEWGSYLPGLVSGLTTATATIVLSGLLTVVVGRAVFGAAITPGEAWQRARGRLLPLFGLVMLEGVAIALLIAIAGAVVWAAASVAGRVGAIIVGIGVALIVVVVFAYVATVLIFAPAVIVLERLGIGAAVERSYTLVRKDFWRVFGIRLLAGLVSSMIGGAVSIPFSIPGQVLLALHPSAANIVLALALTAAGGAIAQIITSPFNAGVVVLLYADRRMRAEAFDLVLHTGATNTVDGASHSIDDLWLTARP